MTRWTHEKLRKIVRLGARAKIDGIPTSDIRRQEQTVLWALDALSRQPGVMLADEVGMGKTFEALAIVAALRSERRNASVLILTPGPDLNVKWLNDLTTFSDPEHCLHDFGQDSVVSARNMREFAASVSPGKITVVPMSAFTSARSREDQIYILKAFVRWMRDAKGEAVNHQTLQAIARRFGIEVPNGVQLEGERFLGAFEWAKVKHELSDAFVGTGGGGELGLWEIFQQGRVGAFRKLEPVERAINLARFRLLRRLIPAFNLVVVDEAHRLKNEETARYQAVSAMLRSRFDRALLLTATPFQLDVSELRQIFNLFSLAKEAPPDLRARTDRLLDRVREYQAAYSDFERSWRSATIEMANELDALWQEPQQPVETLSPGAKSLDGKLRNLLSLKQHHVEPGLRSWMIRSIRKDRRDYRKHDARTIPAAGAGVIPFLLGERLVDEIFHGNDRTHKVSAEVNLVSSYAAARKGALMEKRSRTLQAGARDYRDVLRKVLDGRSLHRQHPKIDHVSARSLEDARRGEKTVIFCTRVESISQLSLQIRTAWREHLSSRWVSLYSRDAKTTARGGGGGRGARKGHHEQLQERFHRRQDALFKALRLRLPQDWHVEASGARTECTLDEEANRLLKSLRVSRTQAVRVDFEVAPLFCTA